MASEREDRGERHRAWDDLGGELPDPGRIARLPLRISLGYVIIAAVWILASGHLLTASVSDPALVSRLEIVKGWAFVVVTGLLLHLTLRAATDRYVREAKARQARQREVERMSQSLRESEELYRTLVSASPDAIAMTDLDGRLRFLSAQGVRLFGLPSMEAALGRPLMDWVVPAERERAMRNLDPILNEKPVAETQITLRREDGTTFTSDGRCRLFRDSDGKPAGMIAVMRDITAQVQLEAQLRQAQKMESLGLLAGGIAHDFNNILAIIMGNTALAFKGAAPGSPEAEYLQDIMQVLRRGKSLVQQILMFSRRQAPNRIVLRLGPVVEEVAKLLRASAPANVDFAVEIASDAPPVRADPVQIHQVLMNLGTNALHALGDGDEPGRVQVKLAPVVLDERDTLRLAGLNPGVHACLSVVDTGCGMDGQTLQHIFEPFFTTKPPGKGSGLGLAVVDGIVKANQAAIEVLSRPGAGTTMSIYFPAAEGEPEPVETTRAAVAPGGQHILLLDDDEPLTRMGRRSLEGLGYRVSAFTSPAEAVAAFLRAPADYQLALVDLNMPGSTGIEVAAELRAHSSELPVLLMTGSITEVQIEHARRAGVSDVLLKPVAPEELNQHIQRVLGRRS